MLFSERYADDSDAQQNSEQNVRQPDPYTTDEEPDDIHYSGKATGTLLVPHYLLSERHQGHNADLHGLKSKWNTDNGQHQTQTGRKILDSSHQPAADHPDDIQE